MCYRDMISGCVKETLTSFQDQVIKLLLQVDLCLFVHTACWTKSENLKPKK